MFLKFAYQSSSGSAKVIKQRNKRGHFVTKTRTCFQVFCSTYINTHTHTHTYTHLWPWKTQFLFKKNNKQGIMATKLDTVKAYDRLDKFIQKCFSDRGFFFFHSNPCMQLRLYSSNKLTRFTSIQITEQLDFHP